MTSEWGETKVSIVTVCLNSVKTISRAIESVLSQTYSNIEYIIVDGQSRDGTAQIVREYEPRFEGRMLWISERDRGIYDAMNKGLGLCTGELIGILNSDDWYEHDAVETMVSAYAKSRDCVLYGLLRFIKDGKELRIGTRNYQFLATGMIPHPTCFVPKAIYEKHGKFDLEYRYAADYELLLRLFKNNVGFVQVNRVITNFAEGGASYVNNAITVESVRIRHRYGLISRFDRDKEIVWLKTKYLATRLLRLLGIPR